MQLSKIHPVLKNAFESTPQGSPVGPDQVRLYRYAFHSESSDYLADFSPRTELEQALVSEASDSDIRENNDFEYPVFIPPEAKTNQAILLLHGLNERNWEKYLPWAYTLAVETRKPVVLFPIAFHINRAPQSWNDPRKMMALSKKRSKRYPDIQKSSYLNLAISERLTNAPQRFLAAGSQSAADVIRLLKSIQHGAHPHFQANTRVDFMAYSIGAFLTQILMLANPDHLMDHARIMLLCGGTELSEMHGDSKFIMDSVAFNRVKNYYTRELEEDAKRHKRLQQILSGSKLGEAFLAMRSPGNLPRLKKDVFAHFGDQLQAIALKKDRVMPALNIKKTLAELPPSPVKVSTLDFGFDYTHETPFPLKNKHLVNQVDQAFDRVFSQIVRFLEPR